MESDEVLFLEVSSLVISYHWVRNISKYLSDSWAIVDWKFQPILNSHCAYPMVSFSLTFRVLSILKSLLFSLWKDDDVQE